MRYVKNPMFILVAILALAIVGAGGYAVYRLGPLAPLNDKHEVEARAAAQAPATATSATRSTVNSTGQNIPNAPNTDGGNTAVCVNTSGTPGCATAPPASPPTDTSLFPTVIQPVQNITDSVPATVPALTAAGDNVVNQTLNTAGQVVHGVIGNPLL